MQEVIVYYLPNETGKEVDSLIVNGNKMREARVRAGKSLQDAAHIAGMSEASISRFETKGGKLNRHICRALAKAYNVPVGSMEAPNIQEAGK